MFIGSTNLLLLVSMQSKQVWGTLKKIVINSQLKLYFYNTKGIFQYLFLGQSGSSTALLHPGSKRKDSSQDSGNNNSLPDYGDVLDDSKSIFHSKVQIWITDKS